MLYIELKDAVAFYDFREGFDSYGVIANFVHYKLFNSAKIRFFVNFD